MTPWDQFENNRYLKLLHNHKYLGRASGISILYLNFSKTADFAGLKPIFVWCLTILLNLSATVISLHLSETIKKKSLPSFPSLPSCPQFYSSLIVKILLASSCPRFFCASPPITKIRKAFRLEKHSDQIEKYKLMCNNSYGR